MNKTRRRKSKRRRSDRREYQSKLNMDQRFWPNVLLYVRDAHERYSNLNGVKNMEIPVIHEDESENEFAIDLCCAECCKVKYSWSEAQFKSVLERVKTNNPFNVPDNIKSSEDLIKFIKFNVGG